MVEGRQDMDHAPWGKIGAVPYQVNTGKRQLSATETGGPVCTSQHIPLSGSGLPLRIRACRALTLPQVTDAPPH